MELVDIKDIEGLEDACKKFTGGVINADEFKSIRLLMGVYAQRQEGKYMMRIRLPWGKLAPEQLRCLAGIAKCYSNGTAHITTRQNVQIYGLALEDVSKVMRTLNEVNVTTREASGNTVRNITACHMAGVCPDEIFDVTLAAADMTRHFLRNSLTQKLPRKVKMSFSGCSKDCGLCLIHDLGFIARPGPGSLPGFRVYVGGGLGSFPRRAQKIEDFILLDEAVNYAQAVIKVFNAKGNRTNRSRARLKFLIEEIGLEAFKQLVRKELGEAPTKIPLNPPLLKGDLGGLGGLGRIMNNPPQSPFSKGGSSGLVTAPDKSGNYDSEIRNPQFSEWRRAGVRPQKQEGYYTIVIPLPVGDITSEQMFRVSELVNEKSAQLRTTNGQDLAMLNVKDDDLPSVYETLRAIGLARPCLNRVCDVTACAGSTTCPSAITSSRGLALEFLRLVQNGWKELSEIENVTVRVTGCPNSCGQYHVANIGFAGVSQRVGDKIIPSYQIFIGGHTGNEKTVFGEPLVKVTARRAPMALKSLLQFYRDNKRRDESVCDFFLRTEKEHLIQAIGSSQAESPELLTAEDSVDWGFSEEFKLQTKPSEC